MSNLIKLNSDYCCYFCDNYMNGTKKFKCRLSYKIKIIGVTEISKGGYFNIVKNEEYVNERCPHYKDRLNV